MSEPRRLVVVAMGFGIWIEGRHELSARWNEVARVAASHDAGGPERPPRLTLVVTLTDGRELLLDPELPGWDAFVAAAPRMLAGMPTEPAWQEALAQLPPMATALLYERAAGGRAPRQRSLQ